jgi:diguanylate cyclase (GGDEF)-like protein/PAS domain S-box-containing protein
MSAGAAPGRDRILVVEDDEGIARLERRRLERAGYAVATATTAAAALARLDAGDIALLVVDQGLPGGVSGLEFYGQLRAAGHDLPVIMVTGESNEAIAIQALRLGVADFVTKSLEYLDYLPEAVARVLAQARTARQLAESDARFRSAFDHAAVGMAVVAPDGRWLQANAAFRTLVGYTEEELRATTFQALTHPDDLAGDELLGDRLRVGTIASYQGEKRYRHKGGHAVWAAVSASLVRDDAGDPRYFITQMQDITARKAAEERVRFQGHLLDRVPLAVIATDLAGTVTHWNPYATTLYGWTAAEALGRPIGALTVGPAEQGTAAAIMARLRAGESWEGEFTTQHQDGTRFPAYVTNSPIIDEQGRLAGIVGVSIDITERLRADAALRASEAALAAGQRLAHLGNWETDLATGATRWSDELYRIFGAAPGAFPPTFATFLAYLHPADRARLRAARDGLMGGQNEGLECRVVRPDGTVRTIYCQTEAVADATGRPGHLRGTVLDITERARAEAALRDEREFLGVLLDHLQEGIVACDAAGTLTLFNHAARELHGLPASPLPPARWAEHYDLYQEDGRTALAPAALPLMRALAGDEIRDVELVVAPRNRPARRLLASGRAFQDSHGNTLGAVVAMHDITARKAAEAARRESDGRYRQLVEGLPDALLVVSDGRIVYVNVAGVALLGATDAAALLDTPVLDLIHPDEREQVRGRVQETEGGRRNPQHEIRLVRRDGSVIEVEVTGLPVTYHGRPAAQAVLRDITQRKALERQLVHQAFHDALTGLANRALFLDRLGHALARAGRQEETLAVLFVDLDGFKVVNDSLGHAAGDALLGAVAARLRACARAGDTVARLGGDEFVLLLEGLADGDEAARAARRIAAALAPAFAVDGQELFVTASVGVALNTPDHDGAEALLRDADIAMYRAKRAGRARWALFDPSMNGAAARLALETDLHRAVGPGRCAEFVLHYQPLIALATGRIAGVEALLRWRHPVRGLVPPGDFIPLAEETGLILPLGRWALGAACRQLRAWQLRTGDHALTVGVNLSASEFLQPDLAAAVAGVLAETGLPPATLTLEITESVLMAEVARSRAALDALRALGVRLAIDDFGTGYSSLAYLQRFRVDTLKIDRAFVTGVDGHPEGAAIVRAIVTLAHALGLGVTAEGVETAAEAAYLRGLGCAQGQGYHFARPLPPEALAARLAERDLARTAD